MLKLLLGTSGIKKTESMFQAIKEDPSDRAQILLTPGRYSADMETRLCQAEISCLECEVWTFDRMYDQLCDRFGGGAQEYLDAGSQLLLMYLAVRDTEDIMESYHSRADRSMDLSALLAVSKECKQCRVNPAMITEAGDRLSGQEEDQPESLNETEGHRLHDIGTILTRYDQLVRQHDAADPADRLNQLESRMEETLWPQNCRFWADGFSEFTPQELAVIERLLRNGNELTVLLDCDDPDRESEDVFTYARQTAKELEQAADRAGTDIEIETIEGGGASVLRHLKENLFTEGAREWESECPEVTVYAADDPRGEVEHAASVILKLTGDNACGYGDFIVTGNRFDRYTDLIESIFSRAGISCSLDGDSRFDGNPVFTLVCAALDTVTGRFRYEDLSRYLKTGLTNIGDEEVDQLDNFALTWDLQGSDWTDEKKWAVMTPVIERKDQEDQEDPNDRKDQEDRKGQEDQESQEEDPRKQVIDPLKNFLDAVTEDQNGGKKSGADLAKALYALLGEINLQDSLIAKYKALEQAGEDKMAEEIRHQWSAVLSALENCVRYLNQTDMDLEEFTALFKRMLNSADPGTNPARLDEVTVAGADRIPIRDAKYLIFLGADGNSVPDMRPLPGILTEQDRKALNLAGIRLGPDQDSRLSREFARIGGICSIPREGLLVSWPRRVEQGAERNQPSFLVERMQRLFPTMGNGPMDVETDQLESVDAGLPADLSDWKPMRSIPPEAAVNLLEKENGQLTISPTDFSDFHGCRFQYFMKKGFEAKPVKKAQFGALEYGSMMHAVLCDVMKYIKDEDPTEPVWKEVDNQTDQAVDSYFGDAAVMVPAREQNWFKWYRDYIMKKAARSAVRNAVEEIYAGGFRPTLIEEYFRRPLPDSGGESWPDFQISGRIDRVDRCGDYLRIVDYKTGSTKFSYDGVLNGNAIQLPFYRMALRHFGVGGADVDAKETTVAGMFYIPAAEPVLKGKSLSKEKGVSKSDTQRRRSGLMLADDKVQEALEKPAQERYRFLPVSDRSGKNVNMEFKATQEKMDLLDRYMISRVKDTCAAVISGDSVGNMQADPSGTGFKDGPCSHCEFRQVCHFEESYGDKRKGRRYSSVKPEPFWEEIAEAVNSAEGGQDHGTDK